MESLGQVTQTGFSSWQGLRLISQLRRQMVRKKLQVMDAFSDSEFWIFV